MGDMHKKTEAMLRAVLISSPRGVPVYRLDREYKAITFQSIPFRELGFGSLESYLRSIPHVASFATLSGETVIKGVASEADKHVAKLIAKQKKPKLKKVLPPRKPSFPSRRLASSHMSTATKATTPRFIPPRMQSRFQSGTSTNLVGLRRIILNNTADNDSRSAKKPPSPRAKIPPNKRNVTLTPTPLMGASSKSQSLLSENVSGSKRTVNMEGNNDSSHASPEVKKKITPATETEIFTNIKKLLAAKPNGIWFTRFGIEFKKTFSMELPKHILEKLKDLPDIVQVASPMPGRLLLYPVTKVQQEERKPNQIPEPAPTPVLEVYTLRPQPLPELLQQSPKVVSVSHIDDLGHFFVQYKDMWDLIDELQENLQSVQGHQAVKANSVALQPGTYCCGQFTEDDQWYRARVTQLWKEGQSPKTVQVIYVDFGNYENLPLDRLRLLRKEDAELPMGAVLCRLEGVEPLDGEWSDEATARFKELAPNSDELKMTAVKFGEHHLHVQLCNQDDVDLGSILVKENLASLAGEAKAKSPQVSPASSTSTSSVSPASSTSVTTNSETSSPPRPLFRLRLMSKDLENSKTPAKVQVPDETFLDLFVCNVLATDNICVSIYGPEYSDKLAALEQSMLVYYADPPQDKPVQPVVGGVFASYSQDVHTEAMWYRVLVRELKDGNVKIEFVDYGDTGLVPVSALKPIPQRFLDLPFQAFSVALNGLPKTKNPEVLATLKRHAQGRLLVGEVVKRTEDVVLVELFDTSTEADININSILRSLVIPDDLMQPVLPKVGESVDMYVTYVSEGGEIFVQLPGAGITRLDELMEDITEHYSKATKAAEFMSRPLVGKICCAKCSEDGVWYRALITQVLPDRQVEVQYVDYGNKECLPSSSLREPTKANEHVSSLPFQAAACRLAGVSKERWNEDLAFKMMALVADQTTTLKVVKAAECPLVVLSVKDEEERAVSVVDLLFDGEQEAAAQDSSDDSGSVAAEEERPVAEQQPASTPSCPDLLPPLGLPADWVDVTVTDVVDPNNFTFQPLERLQGLEDLTANMEQYYNANKVRMTELKTGALCAAFHPEHGQWYRAFIKAVLSPQQVCVRFADYGDFGIVPAGNLQPLATEFQQQPCLGLHGGLSGLVPCSSAWPDEAKKRFEELAQHKMLVAKVMLSASDVSSLPGDEGKAMLSLYDTSGEQDVDISAVLVDEELAKYAEK